MAIRKIPTRAIDATASSANLNLDANTLFLDATNNRIGIGTNSPAAKLDIQGGSILVGTTTAGNSTAGMTFGKVAADGGTINNRITLATYGGSYGAYVEAYANLTASTATYLAFGTQAGGGGTPTERMRIDDNGNVGIGSVPEANSKLKLYSNTSDSKMTVETTNSYTAFTNYSGASNEFSIGFVPSDASFRFCNYGDLTGGERLRITSTGGVQFKTGAGVPAMIDSVGNSMVRFGTFAVSNQGYTDFSGWREEQNNGVFTTTFYVYFGPGPADSRSYWYLSVGTGVSTWMDIFKVDMFEGNWSYGQIVGWKEQTVCAVANTWTVNTLLSLDKVNFGGVNMFATPVGTSYVKLGGGNTASANAIKYVITTNRSWITHGMTLTFSATSPF